MNKTQGWIKLHRKILDNPLFLNRNILQVWIYLLLKANHSDQEWVYNLQKLTIKRGQCVISQRGLAKELKINISLLSRTLKYLKSETQIETQTDRQFTLITIVNYDMYQKEFDTPFDTQSKHKVNTNETQSKTNNNVKNVENVYNDKNDNRYIDTQRIPNEEVITKENQQSYPKDYPTPIKKENKEFKEFITLFNRIVNTNYKGDTKSQRQFASRLKDGYTPIEFEKAITNASQDKFIMGKDPKNKKVYLTPEYITRPDKLEKWLNTVPPKNFQNERNETYF